MLQITKRKDPTWLLFFYSIPSRPVGFRVKIWRRLIKAGALTIKGSVHVLPANDDHFEYFQWLASEVTSRGGEAAFVKADKIEAMEDREIIDLFNRQRGKEYRDVEKRLDEIEKRIDTIRKGSSVPGQKKVSDQFRRLMKEFEEIRRIDFFLSETGDHLNKRIRLVASKIKHMAGATMKKEHEEITHRRVEDYKDTIWVTRKNPFVDRMASAWLIRRFIDTDAVFRFMSEEMMQRLDKKHVTFDVKEGAFTHLGDMCTFEVIMKSFKLADKQLKRIAEIVHELDIKDDRYRNPESRGVEAVLTGIRRTGKSDKEILEKGMTVFDALYVV
jgi:tetrahydromethanopterin S-methyltransferase subunit G